MERTTPALAGAGPAGAGSAGAGPSGAGPAPAGPSGAPGPGSSGARPAGHGRRAPEMQPGMMTDHEISVELKTASGDRRAALEAEREERRVYRASMRIAASERH